MHAFYISAAHKSSGKTTLSVGLAAALAQQGEQVQTFKKGPDYIDPLWLAHASSRNCYNLDFNTQSTTEITSLFAQKSEKHSVAFVEGNKGLFDGMDLEGADANSAMARLLGLPVILVFDCQGITRGIAPLLKGYVGFEPDLNITGVILNKVAGSRHESKLRSVIEHYTDLSVFGAVPSQKEMLSPERHLGLIPPKETGKADETIAFLASQVSQNVDLKLLKDKTRKPKFIGHKKAVKSAVGPQTEPYSGVKIAIVKDAVFGFYYADDLDTFRELGAELLFVDALEDAQLPDCDGLFIGGGFPETNIEKLEANITLREDIREKAQSGLPIYAECGGLMYLARQIAYQGLTGKMCGVLPADVMMHERPQGRGLVKVRPTEHAMWANAADMIKAHEFHYASMENIADDAQYAFEMKRGAGITSTHDGMIVGNAQANFTHMRHTEVFPWIEQFLGFVEKTKIDGD